MDVLKLMVCLMTCVTSGAGQPITVATADQHLLVEAGSPNVTFNADVVAGTEVPIYQDLQFQMGGVAIARPSMQPDGLVVIINQVYQDHFEVIETTLPRVSVKLNNPDMKSHTQGFRWSLATGGTQEVPLIVSDPPVLVLPNEISAGEETQVLCSVRFGLLPGVADASRKIGIYTRIGSGSFLEGMGQVVNDYSESGVATRTYTYNYTFQEQDNGKTLHCVARLIAYPDHKLMTAQQLNVMCDLCNGGVSYANTATIVLSVVAVVLTLVAE